MACNDTHRESLCEHSFLLLLLNFSSLLLSAQLSWLCTTLKELGKWSQCCFYSYPSMSLASWSHLCPGNLVPILEKLSVYYLEIIIILAPSLQQTPELSLDLEGEVLCTLVHSRDLGHHTRIFFCAFSSFLFCLFSCNVTSHSSVRINCVLG